MCALVVLACLGCQASSEGEVEPSRQPTLTASEWRPSRTFAFPEMTQSEMLQARDKYLANRADSLGITPATTPDLVRYIVPEEAGVTYATCLREQGFSATANPDGTGVTAERPDDQSGAYDLALWTCEARYTINPRLMPAGGPPAAYLGLVWDYTNDFLIPCLAAAGHPATEDLPTREIFMTTGGSWKGYPTVADDQAAELAKSCPRQVPSALVLG